MSELRGRVAVVIGGAAGIGLASAQALALKGATVVVADRGAAARTAAAMRESGASATSYEVDGASLLQLRELFGYVEQAYGGLDVLFNNVGTRCANGFDVTEAEFDEAFDVNLKSQFFAINYASPLLRQRAPFASIIIMSSAGGLRYSGRSPLHSMSKATLLMMTRAFARQLGPDGIRVNALCPGGVETSFSHADRDEATYDALRIAMSKTIPLGRLGQPEDVAGVVAFLASDASMYLTGLAVPVDGGALA